jgi:DNA-binding response OmpR family regulator
MTRGPILVVDDEPFILQSLVYLLEREGFDVVRAIDGEEALERARASRPSLIFLDIMLPKRDGYDVCRTIKSEPALRSARIVMLTAKGRDEDRARGFAAGADDYVTKPYSPSRILEVARAALGISTARP